MAYGFDGNMNALDWIHLMGNQGVSTLHADDRSYLREAGILNEENEIRSEQLALAIQYRDQGHVICDAVGKPTQNTEALAAPQCHAYEKDFGLGRHHRFNQ